jgi:uridylate kinase
MKSIILKAGGSYFLDGDVMRQDVLSLFVDLIDRIDNLKLAVIVGGGKRARNYQVKARTQKLTEFDCDLLGINASQDNASQIAKALGKRAVQKVPKTLVEARCLWQDKILVMGGTEPGHTTDAVAALLAEATSSDLIISTNVDGVYTTDPKYHKDAEKIEKMKFQDFLELVMKQDKLRPGENYIVDSLAAKIILRSKIKTQIIDGRAINNVEDAMNQKHVGTIIY